MFKFDIQETCIRCTFSKRILLSILSSFQAHKKVLICLVNNKQQKVKQWKEDQTKSVVYILLEATLVFISIGMDFGSHIILFQWHIIIGSSTYPLTFSTLAIRMNTWNGYDSNIYITNACRWDRW